jgi:sphingolipid delta-4 desaturase
MGAKSDFEWVYSDEPHATRRTLILAKYPQIKQLMTPDPNLKWLTIATVAIQLVSFYMLRDVTSFWQLFLIGFCFGGVLNISLQTAIHEIVHNHAFGPSRPLATKILAIIANLPIGVPGSGSFKKLHLIHHRYQGDDVLDPDIPSQFEAVFFNTTSTKFLWVILHPFFYVLRPLFSQPKFVLNPSPVELANIAIQFTFDYLVGQWLGWHIVAYMIGSTLLCMGVHPRGGHHLSEHFIIPNECIDMFENNNINELQRDDYSKLIPETYSYYGPLNALVYNVGYHVEHHDFPSIPGSLLPRVREIAPEFYNSLPSYRSWVYVIWKYITDDRVGPYSRVKRPHRFAKHDQKTMDLINEIKSEIK